VVVTFANMAGGAQEDVMSGQIGQELQQWCGAERISQISASSDEIDNGRSTSLCDCVEFGAKYQFVFCSVPIDEGQLARACRHRLEQGTKRGDSDAASNEQHLATAPPGGGESAEGAFRKNPRAGRQITQRASVVPQRLNSESQTTRVRWGGQREWVGLVPHSCGQESKPKELPRLGAQPAQIRTLHRDGDRTTGLADYPAHGQTSSYPVHSGPDESVVQDGNPHDDTQGAPRDPSRSVANEISAIRKLVTERQRDSDVGEQM